MNDTRITLSGWLGTDVTLRTIGEEQHVATFRVASTPSRWHEGVWVRSTTTWHTVKVWNRLALHVASSLHSGDPVLVQGRLVANVWEREGKSMTSYDVVASAVGHDLSHGTSVWTRSESTEEPEDAVSQDEAQAA